MGVVTTVNRQKTLTAVTKNMNDLKEVESSEAFKRQLKKAKPTLDKIQFEKEAIMIVDLLKSIL